MGVVGLCLCLSCRHLLTIPLVRFPDEFLHTSQASGGSSVAYVACCQLLALKASLLGLVAAATYLVFIVLGWS